MAVSCPAADAWRGGLLGLSEGAGTTRCVCCSRPGPARLLTRRLVCVGSVGQDPEATPDTTPRAIQALFAEPVRRYGIRADIHYSAEENLIVAMFELPGVKRGDLRVTMSVCPFTRVRQVNIAGLSRSTLPAHGHGVRERKFGQFARTLVVPPETKPEDVQISLEDGILTLRIPGGTPVQTEAPQEIGVP
ncbi:hypothetical protein BD413DRAFT_468043 [Trametes elegans]|nr:hypothetical protein BD413DRAFT_468043 [Trametes elegans]